LNCRSVFPRRRTALSLAIVIVLCAGAALSLPAAGAAVPRMLRIGSVALHRCGRHRGPDHGPGWCAKVPRPLDPGLPNGPKIGIQTQWVPAKDGHAVGTIVAVEGGPGYPSTGSYDEYMGIFQPLLVTHNLVLVDSQTTTPRTPQHHDTRASATDATPRRQPLASAAWPQNCLPVVRKSFSEQRRRP
jgi:hypothetical protein